MKNKIFLTSLLVVAISAFVYNFSSEKQVNATTTAEKRALHKKNIEKSPFKSSLALTKKERKAKGLPPNKYNEEQWQLEMNPVSGRPLHDNVRLLRSQLNEQFNEEMALGRVPGDAVDNGWDERGPNNVGGRTRGIMFDPNDTTDETVFAGGVSGGLWKNTNISNASSQWVQVNSFPENLNVSTITHDPNNTNVFYVGTGESYTAGDVPGDGVWKSSDAGNTWAKVLGGVTGNSYYISASNITINTPSSIAGDYISIPTTNFGPEITAVITADLVLANDGTSLPTEGCNASTIDMTGKIAIIRRGNCNFTDKVKNAQNAGAIGAIVMNNIDGDPIPMGGDDATITIPAVMITKADGDLIEAALGSGTVNGSLNPAAGDFTGLLVPGIQHINDVAVRDNNGVSEIYVAASDGRYGDANAATYTSSLTFGLYKSSDGGANWSLVNLPLTEGGKRHNINDIEIAADSKVWLATTNSFTYNDGGGKIFSSADGVTFADTYTIANGDRTEIAVSKTAADKVYVLAELSTGGITIVKTTSGFFPIFAVQTKTKPNDADPNIPADDFCRTQAWFDLALAVHPTNDEIVFVGGVDLFKSNNGATNWNQISHWYGGFGFQEVHADQHEVIFGSNPSKMVFSNDGGIYYSSNDGLTLNPRDNGFITSQYYTVGVGPTTAFTNGDTFAGGLQDNGTQLIENLSPGAVGSATEPYGGDGAATMFDQDGSERYFIANYVYNQSVYLYNFDGANRVINSENSSNGSFINIQALDSNLNLLYSDYSAGGNSIIRRYSNLLSGTVQTENLTNDLLTSSPTALTVSPFTTTSSTLFVGTFLGDLIKVTNANQATPVWEEISGPSFVGSVSDVEFGATENDIFVTMHNYNVPNVWYTDNGGATWSNKEGNLPDIPVKTILQNPLNTEQVIVGTELGVWYTENFSAASPNWSPAFNGMRNVKVVDLDLRDDNMVFAATHGRGVFSGQFTAASGLSVDEQKIDAFDIFPNPSNGIINLKAIQNFGDAKATIYDMAGRQVFKKDIQLNENTTFEATNLKTGYYVLQVRGENFTHSEKLIIK